MALAWPPAALPAETASGRPAAAGVTPPTPGALEVRSGRLTGQIESLPVGEVLATLSRQVGFTFRGSADLLAHPVSARFDGEPWSEAVVRVLAPFNYVVEYDSGGAVAHVILLGVREPTKAPEADPGEPGGLPLSGEVAELPQPPPPATGGELRKPEAPPALSGPTPVPRAGPTSTPGNPDARRSEAAPRAAVAGFPGVAAGPARPALTPAETAGGPQPPGGVPAAQPLPAFTPISNTTGPPAPPGGSQPLPPFQPIYNLTGPAVPGANPASAGAGSP